jgi:hypothetical protein
LIIGDKLRYDQKNDDPRSASRIAIGILLVDGDANIIHANRSARATLSAGSAVSFGTQTAANLLA